MMKIHKDDEVQVIAGNDRGKRGRVLKVLPREQRVIVEGVNVRVMNLRRTQNNPEGGRVEREMPIHVSNVLLWSDKAGRGVRVRLVEDNGKKVRVGVPCGTRFD